MKFYKVDPTKLNGKTFGNSTAPTSLGHTICNEDFIKVDEKGKVFTVYNKKVWRSRYAGQKHSQLKLNVGDLELFTECEDPGFKKVSNLQFIVICVDYEDRIERKRFKDLQAAVEHCGKLNESTSDNHEVVVEFEYKWDNQK